MTTEESVHAVAEDKRVAKSHALLDMAIAQYNPVAVLGLFSGGHGSITAVHVAANHPSFSYAVHINTGIGVPDTLDFVRETNRKMNWNLREYNAKDCNQDYEQIVKEFGFPGPGKHGTMYIRLKERALRVAIREAKSEYKRSDCVILVSGVRFQESERRMGYKEPITKDGSKIWVNIINDWSKSDCNRYIENNKIPRSPVVDKIHKSGECLCGAYAKPGEFAELKFWYPAVAARIEAMRPEGGKCWGWGNGRKAKRSATGPMCAGCK